MEKDLSKLLGKVTKLAEPVVNVNEISRISEGVVVKGEIISPGDVRVDGKVDGKLRSDGRIVIGEGAELKGGLYCKVLDFWGKMDGDIYVGDTLSLKASSVVKGSIHARRFEVEMGARIDGSVNMLTAEQYDALI